MQYNGKDFPHPNKIMNMMLKTRAKVGEMIIDIVNKNKDKEEIKIDGIVLTSKKYHIGDKTIKKYLKTSIFFDEEKKGNNKFLFFNKTDIILIKEIIYLIERYKNLPIKEKKILSCLLAHLGRI